MILLHRFCLLSQVIILFACAAEAIDKPDRKTRDQVPAKVEPRPLPETRRDGGVTLYEASEECGNKRKIEVKAYRFYENSANPIDFIELYKGENAADRSDNETVNEKERLLIYPSQTVFDESDPSLGYYRIPDEYKIPHSEYGDPNADYGSFEFETCGGSETFCLHMYHHRTSGNLDFPSRLRAYFEGQSVPFFSFFGVTGFQKLEGWVSDCFRITEEPSAMPSSIPSMLPTMSPTEQPSFSPSDLPTDLHSSSPTDLPSISPTLNPTPGKAGKKKKRPKNAFGKFVKKNPKKRLSYLEEQWMKWNN